jgi:nucleoside-diphosphate-sugar epimerase
MNILVTGAGGFIGRHLCKHLSKHHNIIGVYNKKQHVDGCHRHIVCDLTNKEQTLADIAENVSIKVDIIAHLASELVDVRTAEQMDVFYKNMKISETVAALAENLRPAKLINFSTMAVYPNVDGIYSEDSKVWCADNSDCLYGLSKFCAENIFSFMLKKSDIKVTHLRFGQVYGDGMRNDRIMPIMQKELKETNKITVYGNGERVSNFISIQKLLEIINLFLEKDTEGIFNIGDEQISYLEMATTIIEKNGNALSCVMLKERGAKSKFYLDTTKLKGLLSGKGK